MAKEILHLVHSVFFPQAMSEQTGAWQPPVDVYRARAGWLLKVDLAGVEPADITIDLTGRRLRICGMRRDWCLEEGCHCYRMEIAYSRFERTIELPEDLDNTHITTEFRNGMLVIRITPRTDR
jgi:HSP20 family protein